MSNKRKIFIILVILITVIGIVLPLSFTDNRVKLISSHKNISADNSSTSFYKFVYNNPVKRFFFNVYKNFSINILKGKKIVELVKSDNSFFLKSKLKPTNVKFLVTINKQKLNGNLNIIKNIFDYDRDGFPDTIKLTSKSDRDNFLDWFVAIAESQFYKRSYSWYKVHYDCAGLIVFSFKEALKVHDNNWYKSYPYLLTHNIPDVKKYNYPDVPILGTKIFRTQNGYFKKGDIDNGYFSASSDVSNLMNFNLKYIGRDRKFIEKGDIIFYHRAHHNSMPYHSMIYNGKGYMIYHTGPSDDKPEGEVRKVRKEDLIRHPDKDWHPVADNPNFVGIYRWKILM